MTPTPWGRSARQGRLANALQVGDCEVPAVYPGPHRMSAKRCEKCDLLIGEGCACNVARTSARAEYMGSYRWIRFGPDALLISRRNMAHIPGACDHFTEEWVLDPKNGWGWIAHPDASTWDRISSSNPAQATGATPPEPPSFAVQIALHASMHDGSDAIASQTTVVSAKRSANIRSWPHSDSW